MRRVPDKGYILKDFLLGIAVFMILFPIVLECAEIISDLRYVDDSLNDEIAVLQLRRKMIIADDISLNGNEMKFNIGDNEYNLRYDSGRLYLTPGYQLFLNDIESFGFKIYDGMIFVDYEKDGRFYERFIASA